MPQKKAKDLITFKRLDLVVRYLYAKDILARCGNNDILSLYKRNCLMRTGGIEPVNEHGISVKNSIGDYITQFKELIASLQEKGYDKNYPIPMQTNGCLANGAHRIAAAAALEMDVEVQYVERGCKIDFDWFVENGFSTEDKMRILKGFIDIHPENCAIILVWNPCFKYLGHINAFIKEDLEIVGEIELDFEDNYIAFTNALLDIYEPNGAWTKNPVNETIIKKSELLQSHYLSFKVIVVTNQDKSNDKDIHEITVKIKEKVRNFIDSADTSLPSKIFATLHTSANIHECQYLSSVLLSPNNIKHLKMRLGYTYEQILECCTNLKIICNELSISLNDICVIGGAVLWVFGIKSKDVDFTTKYHLRAQLGDKARPLGEGVDIANKGAEIVMPNGENINDDLLVDCCEYHFLFNGLKFANLDVIKHKKTLSRRDKDLFHLRQIDLFENLMGRFEQQRIFKERVMAELKRRGEGKGFLSTLIGTGMLPRWLGLFIACFIPKKKNRQRFRAKFVRDK